MPAAEILDRRNTVTRLTPKKGFPTIIAMRSPIGKRLEAIAAEERAKEEYPNETEISTGIVYLESLPPRYQNAQSSRLVVLIPTRTMTNVARESAEVYFGRCAR